MGSTAGTSRRPARSRSFVVTVTALSSAALILAACGGDDGAETAAGSDDGADSEGVTTPIIGLSSSVQPSYILAMDGPLSYGSQFGMDVTPDDFVSFDSHATVVQAALSGQVEVVGASTLAHLSAISQGQPFRIFAAMNHADDFVIAGRGDVTTLEQLADPEVTVGMDEPGGAGAAIFDAMLLAEGQDFISTDIQDAVVIGSSGGRTSALASGEVDATSIHLHQAESIDEETGDVTIISNLYENVPLFMMQAFAAPEDWLEENPDTAAAFTASLIVSAREMHADYDTFVAAVEESIAEPPDDATLQSIWDLATQHDFWPLDGGLEDDRVQFMIDLAETQGLIEEGLTPDDIVDRRPLEGALELLDE